MTDPVFTRTDPALGSFALRQVDPATDATLLHGWVTHQKARFWLMQGWTVHEVAQQYRAIADAPTHEAFLGHLDDRPCFLVERYDPSHDPIGETYPVQPGDVGMHFLTAPTDNPIPGFTRAVITTVVEMFFADPTAERIVVEPDVGNEAVQALNAAVGFRVEKTVTLPEKQALLSTCTRTDFHEATKARGAALS
ncbi:MAG: GNAT family N-acetyltransferase [Streptosporangiales bacterium]|nr:GNAT family N-acetyltransferase [Streptosporangiales bacterium]